MCASFTPKRLRMNLTSTTSPSTTCPTTKEKKGASSRSPWNRKYRASSRMPSRRKLRSKADEENVKTLATIKSWTSLSGSGKSLSHLRPLEVQSTDGRNVEDNEADNEIERQHRHHSAKSKTPASARTTFIHRAPSETEIARWVGVLDVQW